MIRDVVNAHPQLQHLQNMFYQFELGIFDHIFSRSFLIFLTCHYRVPRFVPMAMPLKKRYALLTVFVSIYLVWVLFAGSSIFRSSLHSSLFDEQRQTENKNEAYLEAVRVPTPQPEVWGGEGTL